MPAVYSVNQRTRSLSAQFFDWDVHGGEHRGYVLSQVDIIHTDDGDISADLFFVFVKGFDGTNSSQIICTKTAVKSELLFRSFWAPLYPPSVDWITLAVL